MTATTYEIEPLYVIDGDTIKANVHLGFGVTITRRLRIAGIDAEPINTLNGQVAMATLAYLLNNAESITAEYLNDDKWGRAVVNLHIVPRPPLREQYPQQTQPNNTINVADILLNKKLAVPYNP